MEWSSLLVSIIASFAIILQSVQSEDKLSKYHCHQRGKRYNTSLNFHIVLERLLRQSAKTEQQLTNNWLGLTLVVYQIQNKKYISVVNRKEH